MLLIQLGQYAGSLTAILILVGIVIKWGIVTPIKVYIDKMTYAIQPHANGGNSLPDLVKTLDRVEKKIDNHINNHL